MLVSATTITLIAATIPWLVPSCHCAQIIDARTMFAGVTSMTASVASLRLWTATHSQPVRNDGSRSGSVTPVKVFHRAAPLISDASSSSV